LKSRLVEYKFDKDVLPAFPRAAEGARRSQAVSRVYGEPVDVWIRDGKPARFVWRDRHYTVLRIFDHWVASREWWKQRGEDPGEPADREFWRVEASPSRNVSAATYELRRDDATGTWLLARIWD
jgi:hypothetical protein